MSNKKSHLTSLSEVADLIQPNLHIHFQVVFSVLIYVGNPVIPSFVATLKTTKPLNFEEP